MESISSSIRQIELRGAFPMGLGTTGISVYVAGSLVMPRVSVGPIRPQGIEDAGRYLCPLVLGL